MWTWLRTLLPESAGRRDTLYHGDAGGMNWRQVAENQRYAVLRRGGLMNLAARPGFAVFWGAAAFTVHQQAGAAWLLLPATLNLWFSLGLFRRYRLIVDTPTSRLSSSAQGYVELCGKAYLPDNEGFRGLPHLPVTVWLPGYVEDEPFVLDDGHGRCLLYPQAAEIVTRSNNNHFSWLQAIYPGQTLYALGELRTHAGDNLRIDRRNQLAELLAEWKRNPQLMLQHFDENGNGQIDPQEWQAVRASAEQQVDQEIREHKRAPGTHVMDTATGGQLFMITNIPPEQLAQRYLRASILHLLVWLGLMAFVHSVA